MRISGTGRPVGLQGGVQGARTGGSGAAFAPAAAEAAPRASASGPSSGPAALAGLDALLALQSIDPDGPRRKRRAAKRGHDLLDVLEEIKVGLLSGTVSGAALDRVVALLGTLESSGDDGLDALIADINLRAEVELAKLGRYVDRPGA
ncbi:flagellar assembly protein FliX [Oharaeibacter diazotrophicus]|uniref:Class II flagellar assembly regulator n=2 Tax=Oharaeibacter diazotrophicus TaxID=1920512 RepID=A0A4R6RM56_9HYPH|nr:flagellar assembly protein FliX [Oharaeibacter diazotrophicus]TDP87640.1 class II flagellar assembly regulator [Oharaeibacter diazotrophicus]BBE74777.1 flagellar assembly protein FliX [Pleomorphomonas sp. SM30]